MTTAAPSDATGICVRVWASHQRTNSLVRSAETAWPACGAAAAPPCGKNATAAVAPAMNTRMSARAAGLARAAFASCRRRRGIVIMGYGVLVPEMMNSAATATYVTTHIRQTIFSSTSEA